MGSPRQNRLALGFCLFYLPAVNGAEEFGRRLKLCRSTLILNPIQGHNCVSWTTGFSSNNSTSSTALSPPINAAPPGRHITVRRGAAGPYRILLAMIMTLLTGGLVVTALLCWCQRGWRGMIAFMEDTPPLSHRHRIYLNDRSDVTERIYK